MIVEFTGLPGAGKTTIADAARERLSRMGYRCRRSIVLEEGEHLSTGRLLAARYVMTRPGVAVAGLRYVLALRPRQLGRVRGILKQMARMQTLVGERDDFAVIEEGVLHRSWSMSAEADEVDEPSAKEFFRRAYRALGVPVAFVFVDADIETLAQRVCRRQASGRRFDSMSPGQAAAALGPLRSRARTLFEHALEVTGSPGLELSGTDGVESNAAAVAAFALAALDGRRVERG